MSTKSLWKEMNLKEWWRAGCEGHVLSVAQVWRSFTQCSTRVKVIHRVWHKYEGHPRSAEQVWRSSTVCGTSVKVIYRQHHDLTSFTVTGMTGKKLNTLTRQFQVAQASLAMIPWTDSVIKTLTLYYSYSEAWQWWSWCDIQLCPVQHWMSHVTAWQMRTPVHYMYMAVLNIQYCSSGLSWKKCV